MIYLSDLSPLMQRAIAKGITFMVSQSGIPHNYNLYFAKYTDKGNCSVLLSYHEQQGKIYQCADENHPVIPFSDINDVLDYVCDELGEPVDKHFDIPEDAFCPYCGCEELDYDLVKEEDGSLHDVVDCSKCKRRLYYEEYEV